MNKAKKPDLTHSVQEIISGRWSPYAFDERLIDDAELLSLFEAARWAASAYNEQPWRFIVTARDEFEPFGEMLTCLVDANSTWAAHASALAIGVVSLNFAHNGQANAMAVHDLGLASATLTIEAAARGIQVHQMSGILPDQARELFNIPKDFAAVTALAIGYPGEAPDQGEGIRERDQMPRSRRPLAETLFTGTWGKAFDRD
jgi:nitroreductase